LHVDGVAVNDPNYDCILLRIAASRGYGDEGECEDRACRRTGEKVHVRW
jgi:hypothetical protein